MWDGDITPREALELINGLVDLDTSRYWAELRGGRQFIGWGEDRRIAAATHDWIRFLIPGAVGVKVPLDAAWPRPRTEQAITADPIGTIADFNAGKFLAGEWD